MNIYTKNKRLDFSITRVLLAGLAGGMAEVLWVMAWSAITPLQATTVAREVTHALFPGVTETVLAVEAGLMIHLALSLALGLAFTTVLGNRLQQNYGTPGLLAGSVSVLALIWAVNFLLVLPVINPAFVTLMPFTVTLGSKILFGLAMGAVLTTGVRTLPAAREVRTTG